MKFFKLVKYDLSYGVFNLKSTIKYLLFVLFITLFSTILPLLKIMRKKIIDVINERDN